MLPKSARAIVLSLIASAALSTNADAGEMEASAAVAGCLQQAATRLPADARTMLGRVNGTPRKVLALRSYLRAGSNLTTRWTWSPQKIAAYERSPEHAAAMAAVQRVSAAFAAKNPGYSTMPNVEVRSVEEQLGNFNGNASVANLAAILLPLAAEVCARTPQTFATFLAQWHVPVAANLAAPGLSPHGQARAFDFRIYRGGELIAGPTSKQIADVWVGQGWADKLAAAVREAGPVFTGPLTSPNEPWHYTYAPAPRRGRR